MTKRSKKHRNTVYSTNPNFSGFDHDDSENETPEPGEQNLRIWLERNRGGKVATVIRDFVGSDEDLKDLGKTLKNLCGVGGTAKNEEIILQGDHRDKVLKFLVDHGYKAKKAGG
jgi:translation initiation factor 1